MPRSRCPLGACADDVVTLAQAEDPGVLAALDDAGRWIGQGAALAGLIAVAEGRQDLPKEL